MKTFFLICVLFFLQLTVALSQKTYYPTRIAISPGFNISKLKNDSSGTTNGAYPLIGMIFNKQFNSKLELNTAVQYSFIGAKHIAPDYKFKNTYVDIQLAPLYALNSFLKVQIGGQYSYLLSSKIIIPNLSAGNASRTITGKYNSQFEIFSGIDFFLQKNASLNFKYSIPLKSLEYHNFQISLNIFIDKFLYEKRDSTAKNIYGMKRNFDGYTEEDGIIYPTDVSSPPQFSKGQASLYQYFEDNVRVFPKDYQEYGTNHIAFLYELKIDTLGKVTAMDLMESSSSSQGTGFQAGHLSDEIRKVIDAMPAWKPAIMDGKKAEVTFYLPLAIQLDMNKIIIHDSKYIVKYKNRKK
jgi:hypothetical protein